MTAACAAALALSCADATRPIDPADRLGVRTESEHFVFLASDNDVVEDGWMESYYGWLVAQLGVQPPGKLAFHKYRDRDHLHRVTGQTGNGFAEPGTNRFHTIWPRDNHEVVHAIVILELGHPPALFNEGVAVAHQMRPDEGVLYAEWNGANVHDIAAEHLAKGAIPPLMSIIESRGFFSHDLAVMYPLAGSFVRWLIDTRGIGPFRAMLRGTTFYDGTFITRVKFRNAFGIALETAWADWQEFLAAR